MTDRPRGAQWLVRLLSCIRFDEVLVLQGAPLLGVIFAMDRLTSHTAVTLLLLAAGNSLLVAHVFLLNDWSGVEHDLHDPSRSSGVFLNRGIRRAEIGGLLLVLLMLSLWTLGRLGAATLMIGMMIAVASALYSLPHLYMKGVPLVNSLLHFGSGVLHFLLGYSALRPPDARGWEIGLFFATIFSAGHLTQEVRDVEADSRNGIQTNAVRFGKEKSFVAGFALFTCANALLVALAMNGAVPQVLAWVAALYPLHLYWTRQAWRAGLTSQSVRRLQARYRWLYAGIGVAMVTAVLSM